MAENDTSAHSRKAAAVYDALDGMTVQELIALGAAVEAKRHEKQEAARSDLLAKWRVEAKEAGFSPDDLLASLKAGPARKGGSDAGKGAGDKLPVKFKGPNGEEWSGRDRLPQWLADAEKAGKNRDDFLIRKPG